MARWMVLYRDENAEPKCAIVNDPSNGNMPFGANAENVIDSFPDYNRGGGAFIVELPDEGEPTVYDHGTDAEISRSFVDV